MSRLFHMAVVFITSLLYHSESIQGVEHISTFSHFLTFGLTNNNGFLGVLTQDVQHSASEKRSSKADETDQEQEDEKPIQPIQGKEFEASRGILVPSVIVLDSLHVREEDNQERANNKKSHRSRQHRKMATSRQRKRYHKSQKGNEVQVVEVEVVLPRRERKRAFQHMFVG